MHKCDLFFPKRNLPFLFDFEYLGTSFNAYLLGIGTLFSIKLSSWHVPPEEFVRDLFTIKIR